MNLDTDTALSVRLEAIQSLAEVARTALPLGMNSVFLGADGLLAISRPPRPSRLKFFVEELQFHVAVSPEDSDAICQIWAECGYVPYTVESAVRRRDVLAVLRAAQGLPRARFVLESGQKILLVADSRIAGAVTPEVLIYEAVELIREARPYLRLLAESLGN
ncbi:MAG: hypothetical protein WCF85_07970 [Rhodospirillaceae bacterium]